MDTQLKEERETMTESEARFEDIARKLATLEAELERSMDRCTTGGEKETPQMIVIIITSTYLTINTAYFESKYN